MPTTAEKRHWQDFEYFDIAWKDRIRLMADYIPAHTRSLIDIGCGKMWLKEFLPSNCSYYGLDYTYRGEDSHVYDLNRHEFPATGFDTSFLSGCLEYINDYEWLIKTIASKSGTAVISYCNFEIFSILEERVSLGWVNHLKEADLIALFGDNHMALTAKDKTSTSNSIYVFSK